MKEMKSNTGSCDHWQARTTYCHVIPSTLSIMTGGCGALILKISSCGIQGSIHTDFMHRKRELDIVICAKTKTDFEIWTCSLNVVLNTSTIKRREGRRHEMKRHAKKKQNKCIIYSKIRIMIWYLRRKQADEVKNRDNWLDEIQVTECTWSFDNS